MTLRKSSIIFYLIFDVIFNIIFLPSSINTFHFHPQDYYDNPAIVETHSHVALDSTPSIHSPMHIEQHFMSNKSSKFPPFLPESKFQGIKSSAGDFQSSNVPKSNLRDTNLPPSYRHHHPRLPIRGVPASSNHGQGQSRPVIDPDDHESNQKNNQESNQKNNHDTNQKNNHDTNQKNNHDTNQEKAIKTKKRAPSSPGSKIQMKKKEIEKIHKVHHHHVHEVSSKEEPEEEKSSPESDESGRGRGPANEGRTSNNEGRSQGGKSKHDQSGHDRSTSGKSKHDHSTGNGNQDQSEAEPEAPQVNVQVLSPEYTSEDYGNQYDTQDPSSGVDPHYHHNLRSYYDYHDPYAYHHPHEPVSYRSEFYWLIPLVMIIGIGALLLPLCSLFMTTLASNGAVGLGGRRRRRKRAPGLNGNFFKENGQGPLLDLKYTGLDIFTLFDDDGLTEQIDRFLTTLGKSIGME